MNAICQCVRSMRNAARRVESTASGKRELILRAALERFSHYGFRRTAMEDIAQQAGISRAAIYLHFRNKEEVFRALAREMHEKAIGAAEDAAGAPGAVAARIEQALAAKLGAFFEIVHATAHARELLDENSRLCGDISAEFRDRHLKLLRGLIDAGSRRGELALGPAGLSPSAAAEMLLDCAKGIESSGSGAMTPAAYQRRLSQMVRVVVLGLGAATVPARSPRQKRAAR
jgi:AcrR family transcriptional regulator